MAGRRMDLDVEWKQGNSRRVRQRRRYTVWNGREQREMLERGTKEVEEGVSTDKYHAISLCAPRREHKHRAAPFVST